MVNPVDLSEEDRELAARKISDWLETGKDLNATKELRKLLETHFPGCETMYLSLQQGMPVVNAEIDNEKIPRFLIDVVGIELFEGKHGKIMRGLLLEKLFKRDKFLLKKFQTKKEGEVEWNDETAKGLLTRIKDLSWTPGGSFAKKFVNIFGFPRNLAGIASPRKEESREEVMLRAHLGPLEPFQKNLANQLGIAFQSKNAKENRAILQLPTGAGKTRTAAEAIIDYWKNRPDGIQFVIWIAQTEELCEQALQCFRQQWEERGEDGYVLNIYRVWDGRKLPDVSEEGLVVAGIDQLGEFLPTESETEDYELGDSEISRIRNVVGLIAIDEAHRSTAPSYAKVLEAFGLEKKPTDSEQIPLIGITATPYRTRDEETENLLEMYGSNVLRPSHKFEPTDGFDDRWRDWDFVVKTLTDEKILSIPRLHFIKTSAKFEMSQMESEYLYNKKMLHHDVLTRVGRDTKRNLEVFQTIKEWSSKGKTILFFGANINQAVLMSKFLNENKIKSAVITADTRYGIRQNYVKMFRENKIQVLCNYGVLTTGFDAPKVDTIIIARPTGSRSLYEQMVGRGLRGPKFGGTETCDIVTVLDNIANFEHRRIKLGYEEFAETQTAEIDEAERAKLTELQELFPAEVTGMREPRIPESGEIFTENQLYERFGVQTAGGIRFTNRHNTVVLVDSDKGHYDDKVDEKNGIVIYTGTGEGDQGFDKGMGKFNSRVRDSEKLTLLYFHKPEKNKLIFKFPVQYESHSFANEKNLEGKDRSVIKFRLRIVLAKCPVCKKIASTSEQIFDLFGYRNMKGITRTQSWCRDCRKL
jgi:superfamily II DNA or RNA helicase